VTPEDDLPCGIYAYVRVVFLVESTTAVATLGTMFQDASYLPGFSITSSSTNRQTGVLLKTLAWLRKHQGLACALDEVRSNLRPTVKH
jgi:hypothetical protein